MGGNRRIKRGSYFYIMSGLSGREIVILYFHFCGVLRE